MKHNETRSNNTPPATTRCRREKELSIKKFMTDASVEFAASGIVAACSTLSSRSQTDKPTDTTRDREAKLKGNEKLRSV
jgi:hypothetical protein